MARRGEGYAHFERAMPLSEFHDQDYAEYVDWMANQPTPPPKWIVCCEGMIKRVPREWFEWHWRRGIYPGGGRDRPPLAQAVRAAVIERDGYVCGICGEDVDPGDVHIDHIYPWSLGGTDDLENLQVAHSICNIRKGNRI